MCYIEFKQYSLISFGQIQREQVSSAMQHQKITEMLYWLTKPYYYLDPEIIVECTPISSTSIKYVMTQVLHPSPNPWSWDESHISEQVEVIHHEYFPTLSCHCFRVY